MYRPTIPRSEAARAAKASSRNIASSTLRPRTRQLINQVSGPPRNKFRDHAAVAEPVPQPHPKRLRRGVGFQLSYLGLGVAPRRQISLRSPSPSAGPLLSWILPYI